MARLIVLRISRLILFALVCSALFACSSRFDAMSQSAKAFLLPKATEPSTTTLNPSIRYLRVTIGGRVNLLALGYIDAHPLGPIEVWYSARGEVLRMQLGHVVGLTGADIDWREVRLSNLFPWPAGDTSTTSYTRIRDVMPGYRFGVVDQLQLRSIDAPDRSHLIALLAQNLKWYEAREARGALPAARFALSTSPHSVVYGEQCIAPTLCLAWQQWPPVLQAP